MPNLLERGIRALNRAAPKAAGGRVRVTRGDDAIEIDATFGSTTTPIDDGRGGVRIERTDIDFSLASEDYCFGGKASMPEPGDLFQIVSEGPAFGEVYEAAPIPGELCYRKADTLGLRLRIHCKKVK